CRIEGRRNWACQLLGWVVAMMSLSLGRSALLGRSSGRAGCAASSRGRAGGAQLAAGLHAENPRRVEKPPLDAVGALARQLDLDQLRPLDVTAVVGEVAQ